MRFRESQKTNNEKRNDDVSPLRRNFKESSKNLKDKTEEETQSKSKKFKDTRDKNEF